MQELLFERDQTDYSKLS